MKLGSQDIVLKLGSADVKKAYLGSTEVYSSSILPTGYTQLQYVSSAENGGWVDTDILPSDTLGFKTRFKTQTVNPRDVSLMGARETTGNTRYTLAIYNGTAALAWLTWPSNMVAISANTWYEMLGNWNNSRTYVVNNVGRAIYGTQGAFTKTIQIFGANFASGHQSGKECSFERITFSLGEGDNIVADMIPCIDPNNEVGFYDIVRERFFGSGNGIALIAGPAT